MFIIAAFLVALTFAIISLARKKNRSFGRFAARFVLTFMIGLATSFTALFIYALTLV